MMNEEAIHLLQQNDTISTIGYHIAKAMENGKPVVLPDGYELKDIERYLPNRRRLAGVLCTSDPEHFQRYCEQTTDAHPRIFVDAKEMQATAVLNFGAVEEPGHGDNRAQLNFKKLAAFRALLKVDGIAASQRAIAEFLEDWLPHITAYQADSELQAKHVVAAVRNVDIEVARKVENTVESLSESRSAFEQVKASSKHVLPDIIEFRCEPYLGLQSRTFTLRLSVATNDSKPMLTLRIQNLELHEQEMADEACELIENMLGTTFPVFVGTYRSL